MVKPLKCALARVYVEGYHWNQDRQADKNGLRIGSEMQLTPRVSVDMGYNKSEHIVLAVHMVKLRSV